MFFQKNAVASHTRADFPPTPKDAGLQSVFFDEKRLAAYHTAVQEHQDTAQTWDLYSQINLKAHRKPNPLSIFNIGVEKSGADLVSIQLATPIWEKAVQKHGSDNPFLSIFLAIDAIFVFKIILSALAIRFAYNTISGEHEDGRLKAVPRFKEHISHQSIIFPLGLLILFNVLFFIAAQLSFLKCDLK